jgi:ubiquinone/menaquinone biosynthesis C-methylase UbiE
METTAKKPYRGLSMEGGIATWYAKMTRKDLSEFERLAREFAATLPRGARVLEIAPGPGYLAVALAKLGPFKVTGLDISQSFVQMASKYANREGVTARFIHGSASDIPLEDGLFNLIVCRAAFKNFSEPLKAINEMHRVLKPGGRAVIMDLSKDAPWQEIVSYVDGLHVSALNGWLIKFTFKHMLLKRAYSEEQMKALAASSDFKSCEIVKMAVGMDVRFVRREPLAEQAA